MSRSVGFGQLVLLLGGAGACDSPGVLAQRCTRGETEACRKACDKGITGEGGCFQAGQAALREAGSDHEGPEWLRAARLFRKACEGGYADGCLFAAQMVEAPFAELRMSSAPTPSLVTIDDTAIDERRQWLERGCKLDQKKACLRLGDVTIGKKSDVAKTAYGHACALGSAQADCQKARAHEVDVFERYRDACRRQVADSCTALGNLVYRVDFPRAVRVFVAEAEQRGIVERAGGMQAFVERRIREARGAGVVDPTAPTDTTAAVAGVSVELPSPTIRGRLAMTFVRRAISNEKSQIAFCARELPSGATLALTAELVVDRTGDVWSAALAPKTSHVAACVADVLERMAMEPPVEGIAEVTQSIVIRVAAGPDGGLAPAPADSSR